MYIYKKNLHTLRRGIFLALENKTEKTLWLYNKIPFSLYPINIFIFIYICIEFFNQLCTHHAAAAVVVVPCYPFIVSKKKIYKKKLMKK